VHHVCGERNLDESRAELERSRRAGDALAYELVGYEQDMPALYARASLAVCRSGAGTIAEVAAAGMPAVFVPLPNAPSDHQMRNARTLEKIGAAVVLPDDECDPARLDAVVSELLADPNRLQQMSDAARSVSRLDAAARLADVVEEHARA
jgi:UDP-N-acetylglucosamine--N-acetylmuramyl-(pentapeptide) pyrophosphoryl-undecaprenol N-acetylglucosamine transferase